MADIPSDIITLVLGEAYYLRKADFSAEHQPDNPTLRSCALVNSIWREAAQSLLFKSVVCNPSFANTALEENSALLKHIRIIDFTTPEDENALEEFGKLVCLTLDRCPSLYEIIWRGAEDYALSDTALSDMRRRGLSIRSLRICWRDPSSDFHYRLPNCFPSLRFLSITSEGIYLRVPTPPSDFFAGLSLLELRLSGGPDSPLTSLCKSQHSIQILQIPSIPNLGILEIIRPHFVHLRSLRLKRFTEVERSFLEACPRLEELMVMVDSQSDRLPAPLPPLKHLLIMISWGSDGGLTASSFMSVVLAVAQPGALESIRLRGPTWNLDENLPALRNACENRGVDLSVKPYASWPVSSHCRSSPRRSLTRLQDEMCVKTSTGCKFPRKRSISNFALMN